MPRTHIVPLQHREYVKKHYQARGAPHCARATGLSIVQVWGIASRIGVGKQRGPQRHATRTAENGRRGIAARSYCSTELEAVLQGWSASPQESPT